MNIVRLTSVIFISYLSDVLYGQILPSAIQVKITDLPFPVSNAQQLNQIVWTMLGTTTKETIYCVSEAPVSQLRFVCLDCFQKNITDMVDVLSSAQDLTRSAGFPTVALRDVAVNPNWTGASIICQAALNGETISSATAVIDIRYLKQPRVVDASGQGPILIASQGYRFYVECARTPEGHCQPSGRRKVLRCAVQAHPPAKVFRWLKNGVVVSGNSADITIGTEMIGQSIQCAANNDLYSDIDMPSSQAVQIDPYTAAHLVQDNFQQLQVATPFQSGNRIDMNQQVSLGCQVEGNPRPIVYWKMQKSSGKVVDASCPQGFDGQYQEVAVEHRGQSLGFANIIRLNAICSLRIANYSYSGQYWCSACSFVSQGAPECSPSLETPGASFLTVQVQGPPMQSDASPTIQKSQTTDSATVTVHYCSEPLPKLPRDVIFSIDQNELQVGQSWQNFRFEGTTQNNTMPNCHLAQLEISPLTEDDHSRQAILKVQNTYGSKHIQINLSSLLGGGRSSVGSLPNWLLGLVVFVSVGICIALCVFACIRKRLCCFNKSKTSAMFDDNKKANGHVRHTYIAEDTPRPLYQPSGHPAERLDYESAVQAAYCDSRMSSV